MQKKLLTALLIALIALMAGLMVACGDDDDDSSETTSTGSSYTTLSVENVPDNLYAGTNSKIKIKVQNTGFENLGQENVIVILPEEIQFVEVEGEDKDNTTALPNDDGTTTVTIVLSKVDANSLEDISMIITTNYDQETPKRVTISVSVIGDRLDEGELEEDVEVFVNMEMEEDEENTMDDSTTDISS